ncbi:hypothetical protein BI364_15560 [Acidihalobacter yilgarnensis]|uniref:Amine oxidase domain-containing protein n=1 Tax=Acidihalobacter yilgarnensis TaxID=2819280 RepID=A0A1D8IRM8_9GAMM|nr:FAD-dependent oxidoreductase [Acidihalobacter yilgarnensis]AOU99160.1 hypothetical protein BI364_15560 [Acidihalobacter yilgarnensis]
MQQDCVIIGAGLSGLYIARALALAGADFTVLEARERAGGRILSRAPTRLAATADARFDLGPAWVWPHFQPLMDELIQALDLPLFAQAIEGAGLYEDASQAEPQRMEGQSPHGESRRIAGGAGRLIEALCASLPAGRMLLGHTATRIEAIAGGGVAIHHRDATGTAIRQARRVVLALPPRLIASEITFEPPLPSSLQKHLTSTPTWMAAHAKLVALYEHPFWREQGLSGEAFSRRGPLTEIYDASPHEGGPHALFGFYGVPAAARRALGHEALIARGLDQLERLFGPQARTPIECLIKDWSESPLTATPADEVPPPGHPDYGLGGLGRSLWDGRLLFAGTESAERNGGYLEGAVEAGVEVLALLDDLNTQ